MGLVTSIWPPLLLLFTVSSGQNTNDDIFGDVVVEDDGDIMGMGFLVGADGATEIPTITPTLTITPTTVTVFPTTSITQTVSPSAPVIPTTQTPFGCPSLPAPTNGQVVENCNQNQCTATFTCDTGYEIQGDSVLTCQAGSTWNGPPPTCILQSCEPVVINNGQYNGGVNYGDSGTVTCDENFQLSPGSDATIECLSDGWSSLPTCEFVDCGTPQTPQNGAVEYQCKDAGCKANYTCEQGFEPSPGSVVTCIDGVGWEYTVVCVNTTTQKSFDATLTTDSNQPVTSDFRESVQQELFSHFKLILGEYLIDVLTYVNNDTGVINYTVIVQDEEEAIQKLSVGFSGLAQGSRVEILGQPLLVRNSTVLGYDVRLNATGCEVYEDVFDGKCPEGTQCVVKDNVTQCEAIQTTAAAEDDNLPLIIGLSVGIPLFVLGVVIAIICCYCCCCAGAAAGDDESDHGRRYWHIGWLPRYMHVPLRLDTKRTRLPDYFYTPSSPSRSTSSSRTGSRSRSKSRHSRRSRSDGSSHRSLHRGRRDMPYSNFSWDNLFYSNYD